MPNLPIELKPSLAPLVPRCLSFCDPVESFLSDRLLPIVAPYLDPCQYGLKGASITHYLLRLLKFIHKFLDLKDPYAVIVALVDLSKAFNRVSHQMVIEDLHAMHVPPWLLLILISYLSGRTMVLHYKGPSTSPRNLPGSYPQGAFLGIFFFIVNYNGAALRPKIPRLMLQNLCKVNKQKTNCETPSCSKHPKDKHCVYIDDLSEAGAVSLKRQAIRVLPHLSKGQLSKETMVQGDKCPRDSCPRRFWSEETFVQGSFYQ